MDNTELAARVLLNHKKIRARQRWHIGISTICAAIAVAFLISYWLKDISNKTALVIIFVDFLILFGVSILNNIKTIEECSD